jgi:glycerophosphoryl diester phosphodiesterase
MNFTRRQAALIAAAAAATPSFVRAEAPRPPIFFVAAGSKAPARAAYEEAIARGADFLTAPVVASSDGGLAVAPDNELSAITDVASRPNFADRRKDKTIGGVAISGWFSEDFSLPELKSLAAGPARANGRTPTPTLLALQDVIDIARAGSVATARVVGVSPRLVHPAYFAAQDLDLETRLAALVRLAGYDSAAAAMIVQSSEPAALKAFGGLSSARRIQLIESEGGPADPSAPRYQAMVNAEGLRAVGAWARAIGAPESLVIQPGPKGAVMTTGLINAVHAAGLRIFVSAAAPAPHEPYGSPRSRLTAIFLAGADGVMYADVALAVRARADAMDKLHGQSS